MAYTSAPFGSSPTQISPTAIQFLVNLYATFPQGWLSAAAYDNLANTLNFATGQPNSLPANASTAYSLFGAMAAQMGYQIDNTITPSKLELRLATMDGQFLDLFAQDFFGVAGLPRGQSEPDANYRTRIKALLLTPRVTRTAISNMLVRVTGQTPRMEDPGQWRDAGAYGKASGGVWQSVSGIATFGMYYSGRSTVSVPAADYGIGTTGSISVDTKAHPSRYAGLPSIGFIDACWPSGVGWNGNAGFGYGRVTTGHTDYLPAFNGANLATAAFQGYFYSLPSNFTGPSLGYVTGAYIGPGPFTYAGALAIVANAINQYRATGVGIGIRLLSAAQLAAIS
jgi:hypothetical protein